MKKIRIVLLLTMVLAFACSKDQEPVTVEEPEPEPELIINFKGFNWADPRDNFVNDWLIPSGLESTDNYAAVQLKTQLVLTAWQDQGVNTIRLPINPSSVRESWWNSYQGAIDMAISINMNVILACWEGASSKDGRIDNLDEFWDMWQIVTDKYSSNARVYFEVFNEPHGYNQSDLVSLYKIWLGKYSGIPHNRVLLGGTGYSENVANIGPFFSDCMLSQHLYAWWGNYTSSLEWQIELDGRIGKYGSRTILTEFGAPMTTGKNYTGTSADIEIAYITGVTKYCRDNGISNIYWPGLRDDDSYSLYTFNGSMNVTNLSGLNRIKYGWKIVD